MTEQEQYTLLMTMEDKLLAFNKYGEVTLQVEDFDTLKKLYSVYYNKFTQLNTTCSACVREILNICISRYSALKKQFDKVAPEPTEDITTATATVDEPTQPVWLVIDGKFDTDDNGDGTAKINLTEMTADEIEKVDAANFKQQLIDANVDAEKIDAVIKEQKEAIKADGVKEKPEGINEKSNGVLILNVSKTFKAELKQARADAAELNAKMNVEAEVKEAVTKKKGRAK